MREGTILRHIPYGVDDVAFEVEFDSINDEKLTRVYFVTDEGISRHTDVENLNKCLDPDSGYKFDVDAFFFRGDKAVYEANVLLNCYMISNHHIEYMKRKIVKWSPESKYIENGSKKLNISSMYGNMKWPGSHVPFVRREPKIGRNDLCPCGSGKKYKKCKETHDKI